MKISILSLSIVLLCFSACSTSTTNNKALQDSVIAVHDEVMPLMGDFVRNSIQIDTLLGELSVQKELDASIDTVQARLELETVKGKIDQATESMNDWMYGFETDYEGKSAEEVKAYLDQELLKIKEVQGLFDAASKESTSVLEKYKK